MSLSGREHCPELLCVNGCHCEASAPGDSECTVAVCREMSGANVIESDGIIRYSPRYRSEPLGGWYDDAQLSVCCPATRQYCQVRLHCRCSGIRAEDVTKAGSNSSSPRHQAQTEDGEGQNVLEDHPLRAMLPLPRVSRILTTVVSLLALLPLLSSSMVLNSLSVTFVPWAASLWLLLFIFRPTSMGALKVRVPKLDKIFSSLLNSWQECSAAFRRRVVFFDGTSSFLRFLSIYHLAKQLNNTGCVVAQRSRRSIRPNPQQRICHPRPAMGSHLISSQVGSTVPSFRISLLLVLLFTPLICLGGDAAPQYSPAAGCLRGVCQIASFEVEEDSWNCHPTYLDDQAGVEPVPELGKSRSFDRQKRTPAAANTPGKLNSGEQSTDLTTNKLLPKVKRELVSKNTVVSADANLDGGGRRFLTKRDNRNPVFDDGDFYQDDYTLDAFVPTARRPHHYVERYKLTEPLRSRPDLGTAGALGHFGGVAPAFGRRTGGGAVPGEEGQPFTVKEVTCRHDKVKISNLDQLCGDEIPSFAYLVRKIDLSNNSLSVLTRGAFTSYTCLRKLELRSNGLRTIHRGAFTGLSDLRRLDLSNNELSTLNGGQLEGLPLLRRLKLGGNPLHTLHPSLYRDLPSLTNLDLINTQLRCDCRLAWLVAAANGRPVEQSFLTLPGEPQGHSSGAVRGHQQEGEDRRIKLSKLSSCEDPAELEGRALKSLDPSVLSCGEMFA